MEDSEETHEKLNSPRLPRVSSLLPGQAAAIAYLCIYTLLRLLTGGGVGGLASENKLQPASRCYGFAPAARTGFQYRMDGGYVCIYIYIIISPFFSPRKSTGASHFLGQQHFFPVFLCGSSITICFAICEPVAPLLCSEAL